MKMSLSNMLNFTDRVQVEALNHRLKRSELINSNIANAETPGYRAIGYDFEQQLQSILDHNKTTSLKATDPNHRIHPNVTADAHVDPDVYVEPSESVTHDGNTVDVDQQMAKLAQNQLLYRMTVETINRKLGMLRYSINGGR